MSGKKWSGDAKWAQDERRLSSVYDDINARSYKNAWASVNRYLKKSPSSQPALVLYMVLHASSGASQGMILDIYRQIKSTGEFSQKAFWQVSETLQEVGLLDVAYQHLQDGQAKHPEDPEIPEQIFFAAARGWNWSMMTATSRKIFNAQKEPKWARLAAWAEWSQSSQGSSSISPADKMKACQVASILLKTAGADYSSPDFLWLHLQVLMAAGQYSEATSLAQSQGKDGNLSRMWHRMRAVAHALEKLQEKGESCLSAWETEYTWVSNKLKDPICNRNYAFYRHLVLATISLVKGKRAAKKSSTSSLTRATEHLISLSSEIGTFERSPLLALLQLGRYLKPIDSALAQSEADWTKLVEEYWDRWGCKGSAISELEGIIEDSSERLKVLQTFLEEKANLKHNDLKSFRELAHAQLWLLRHPSSTDSALPGNDLGRLWTLSLEGRQYGQNLPKTDLQHGDDIGLAYVYALIQQWQQNQTDDALLFRAIIHLRYMMDDSPNAAVELILMRLYRLIGAPNLPAPYMAKALTWRGVTIDTLGHFAVERHGVEGHVVGREEACLMYHNQANGMYQNAERDMPKHVSNALEQERFSQVHEMHDFNDQIQTSFHRAFSTLETLRLSVVSKGEKSSQAIQTLNECLTAASGAGLSDTRDWTVLPDHGDRTKWRELLALGSEPDQGWVENFTALYLGLVYGQRPFKWSSFSDKALLPEEKEVIRIGKILMNKASGGDKETTGIDLVEDDLLKPLDALLDLITSDKPASTWSHLHRIYSFLETIKLLGIVHSELSPVVRWEQDHPDLKPDVTAALKHASTLIPKIHSILDGLRQKAAGLDWSGLMTAETFPLWHECGHGHVETHGKELKAERLRVIDRLKELLVVQI